MFTVLRDADNNARFQSTFPSQPASSHPTSFIMNILAGRWRFGQKMSDPFILISFLKIYTQAFRHLIEKPEKARGRITPGNHFETMHFFFSGNTFYSIGFHRIRTPAASCSLSFENPEEAFLPSLLSWEFKSSTGWHDNSNTQFSLLSPSVAETQPEGLPGKAVAKETAVHSSPVLSLAEGHCRVVLGPLLSKTSLAT